MSVDEQGLEPAAPGGAPAGDAGIYHKVSENEFGAERFDLQAVDPTGPVRKYVICSTQRSGSWLLCRQLINAGIGVPHEYFNRRHVAHLCQRWNVNRQDAQAYVRTLIARRTTPNGVWGTKLQWDQHLSLRPYLDADILEQARFLFLYRSDRAAQAVSLHISMATGLWGFDGVESTKRSDVRLGDLEHLLYCIRKIDWENEAWRAFMAERGIEPFSIRYEDFTASQSAYVQAVARFLGLNAAAYRVPPPEPAENAHSAELDEMRRSLLGSCRQLLDNA